MAKRKTTKEPSPETTPASTPQAMAEIGLPDQAATAVAEPAEPETAEPETAAEESRDGQENRGPRLTAEDVLSPKEHCTARGLQSLLGIPEKTTDEAMRSGRLRCQTMHVPLASRMILGARILGWIAADGIPCEPTELAAKAWRSKHPDHGLTAAQVIQPGEWYTLLRLEKMLGIPMCKLLRAAATGGLGETDGRDEGQQVTGQAVLDWISKHRVMHAVSRKAAEAYRREHPEAEQVSEREDDPFGKAFHTLHKERELQREQEARDEAEDWAVYVAAIQGGAADDPDALTGAIYRLDITPDQVRRDREIVARACQLEELWGSRERAAEARREAFAAYKEMEERHKAEEKDLFTARVRAEGRSRQCYNANHRLETLSLERPQLFARNGPINAQNPPRLRRPSAD